jgi:CheY-like chemotaxis protein
VEVPLTVTDKKGLVLVVDDDDDIRESLEVLLRLHGYHVATAADGAEALARLQASGSRPCLILLDLMMPGMNGFELRNALNANASLADIPVVVITGAGAKVADRASAMRLDVLRKPFEPLALLQKVRRFCLGGAAATGP